MSESFTEPAGESSDESSQPTLLFISTRFLFPADSGGKIRTSQTLRGLKGGAFRIRLLMPGNDSLKRRYAEEIQAVCDDLVMWPAESEGFFWRNLRKLLWLFRKEPVPVRSDWSTVGSRSVHEEIDRAPDLIVFDFPHSTILTSRPLPAGSVIFTHNVEAEIFRRHWQVARTPFHRLVWRSQYEKMLRFEQHALQRFDTTIAVSKRDCDFFREQYGIEDCQSIPTGVDTDYFQRVEPKRENQIVFCGSMDWMANIDGVEWFLDEVWPSVLARCGAARMTVVGREPPPALVAKTAGKTSQWTFTGFVDDVRPHIAGADVFVIPLRVGGGTRIKAFEAMAMGCPVVSTSIGIEGLPVIDNAHYLRADDSASFADAVVRLLTDGPKGSELSKAARDLVEERYGYQKAADEFGRICLATLGRKRIQPHNNNSSGGG